VCTYLQVLGNEVEVSAFRESVTQPTDVLWEGPLQTIEAFHDDWRICTFSRVGLDRLAIDDARLMGRLKVFLSFSAVTLPPPSCDALCSGRTSSVSSTLRRFGLSLR
jgi:hypothetical protein